MITVQLVDNIGRYYTYSSPSYRNCFIVVRNALALHHLVSVELGKQSYPIESLQDLEDIKEIL